MARGVGPFNIIERVGDYAYKLHFLSDMAVSTTFDVRDLSPYVENCFEDPSDLRTHSLTKRDVDVEQNSTESSQDLNQ